MQRPVYTTTAIRMKFAQFNNVPQYVHALLDLEDQVQPGPVLTQWLRGVYADVEGRLSCEELGAAPWGPEWMDQEALAVQLVREELERATAPSSVASATASRPQVEPRAASVSFVLFKPVELVGVLPPYALRSGAPHYAQHVTWLRFSEFLNKSIEGDPDLDLDVAKRKRGAWLPGRYRAGTSGHAGLSAAFVSTKLFVLDVDDGDPHAVGEMFGDYTTVIHSTYKHRPETPRCRVVFLLKDECTSVPDYDDGHRVFETLLAKQGIVAPAKDARLGRIAYLPMHQRGVTPVHLVTQGRPLDLVALLAPLRAKETPRSQDKRKPMREPSGTGSAYAQGALRSATEHVASASQGDRHNVLVAEGAALSRRDLELDAATIIEALLPAAVLADPETPESEHLRCIRWGLQQGGKAQ